MAAEPQESRRRSARRTTMPLARPAATNIRIGPRRDGSNVATITPYPAAPAPSADQIGSITDELAASGYVSVFTAAIPEDATQPYLASGFALHERLHLLEHPLVGVERPTVPALRRGRRSDIERVLVIDAAAFEPFWRLDGTGINEARAATPSHRFRVVAGPPIAGYAIWGRAGATGYLQRLAVDPAATSCGLGSALVRDGLWWAAHKGVDSVLVNTQVKNERAFRLYRSLGFEPRPDGLVVLGRSLAATGR